MVWEKEEELLLVLFCVLGMPLPSYKVRVLVYLWYAVCMDCVCTCSLRQTLLPMNVCEFQAIPSLGAKMDRVSYNETY